MSIDQEFEQEWAEVKRLLSELNGYTVSSLTGSSSSYIENISDEGIRRRVKNTQLVKWDDIKEAYRELYVAKVLFSSQTERVWYGAFCRAMFAKLTTAEKVSEGRTTFLRYAPEGRPPRLV